jgi:hypothetical protein
VNRTVLRQVGISTIATPTQSHATWRANTMGTSPTRVALDFLFCISSQKGEGVWPDGWSDPYRECSASRVLTKVTTLSSAYGTPFCTNSLELNQKGYYKIISWIGFTRLAQMISSSVVLSAGTSDVVLIGAEENRPTTPTAVENRKAQ